jgi:hypothetical protein
MLIKDGGLRPDSLMLKLSWAAALCSQVEEPIYAHLCWGLDAPNGTTSICISRSLRWYKLLRVAFVKLCRIVELSVKLNLMSDDDLKDAADYDLLMIFDHELILCYVINMDNVLCC